MTWLYHKKNWQKTGLILTEITLTAIVIAVCYSHWPVSRRDMKKSIAVVEWKSCYAISVNGKEAIFFGATNDSAFTDMAVKATDAMQTRRQTGCWVNGSEFFPSCYGKIITPCSDSDSIAPRKLRDELMQRIKKEETYLSKIINILKGKTKELDYYLRIHNVQDEGFNMISDYARDVKTDCDSAQKIMDKLKSINPSSRISVKKKETFCIVYKDGKGNVQRQKCHVIIRKDDNGLCLMQADTRKTPDDVCALSINKVLPLHLYTNAQVFTVAFPGMGDERIKYADYSSSIIPCHVDNRKGYVYQLDMSTQIVGDGSPVFNKHGMFLGWRMGAPENIKDLKKGIRRDKQKLSAAIKTKNGKEQKQKTK